MMHSRKKALEVLLAVILIFSFCLVACGGGGSVPATVIEEEDEPLSSVKLEAFMDYLVKKNKKHLAAMSVSVFTREDVLLEKAYGYASIVDRVLNDADTVFEWGSISKLLVWVSAMQLYEQGMLDLDVDIRTYLPNDMLTDLKYNVTMINLMSHSAGWPTELPTEVWLIPEEEDAPTLEDGLKSIEIFQTYEPGTKKEYSNYGASLAGFIVERISGEPFWQYVHENIFDPLGMTQTALRPDLSDNAWVKAQRGKLRCYTGAKWDLGALIYQMPTLYPAGMATGTITDLRKFAQALIPDENGVSVLFERAETLAEMYTPIPYSDPSVAPQFCHGFIIISQSSLGNYDLLRDIDVVGHDGMTAGCATLMAYSIDYGFGVAVMTNQSAERLESQHDKHPRDFPYFASLDFWIPIYLKAKNS